MSPLIFVKTLNATCTLVQTPLADGVNVTVLTYLR